MQLINLLPPSSYLNKEDTLKNLYSILQKSLEKIKLNPTTGFKKIEYFSLNCNLSDLILIEKLKPELDRFVLYEDNTWKISKEIELLEKKVYVHSIICDLHGNLFYGIDTTQYMRNQYKILEYNKTEILSVL